MGQPRSIWLRSFIANNFRCHSSLHFSSLFFFFGFFHVFHMFFMGFHFSIGSFLILEYKLLNKVCPCRLPHTCHPTAGNEQRLVLVRCSWHWKKKGGTKSWPTNFSPIFWTPLMIVGFSLLVVTQVQVCGCKVAGRQRRQYGAKKCSCCCGNVQWNLGT